MTNTDIDTNRVLYNPAEHVSPIKVEDEGEDPLPRRTGNYQGGVRYSLRGATKESNVHAKNAYGIVPTSATTLNNSSSISLAHFDEQSFIRNLLTNDRVLHYNN